MKKRLWRALCKSFPMTLRWFMAMIFLLYGGVKLIFGQFGHIPLNEITQAAAQKGEGFAITWAFFGYSRPYELFVGLGEVIPALLLLNPRTATLGAVMYFPVAFNVMLVNYFYHIGVHDLSTVLVIMNLVLLWLDRRKLLMIFWKNIPTGQASEKGREVA
ncbi:hypothetical protein CLV36_103138 [Laceyella sediminis]|uniref:DoxX-like protein n=2 Tax=Laceyella sediminis TaxID=573074 RepID=A0ABX5ESM6_9BACL|nr:hypothetical protein CLV36_103138 [Laceyella sediminis]